MSENVYPGHVWTDTAYEDISNKDNDDYIDNDDDYYCDENDYKFSDDYKSAATTNSSNYNGDYGDVDENINDDREISDSMNEDGNLYNQMSDDFDFFDNKLNYDINDYKFFQMGTLTTK